MPRYEYQRPNFQPIPTPEEEARDDAARVQGVHGAHLMAALMIMVVLVIFRQEIALYGSLIIDSIRGCCG